MSRVQNLKVWEEFFPAVADGSKPFEVRRNDRDFRVGDLLKLREFRDDAKTYTGRSVVRRVTYVLDGGQFGLRRGFVVLGLRDLDLDRLEALARRGVAGLLADGLITLNHARAAFGLGRVA